MKLHTGALVGLGAQLVNQNNATTVSMEEITELAKSPPSAGFAGFAPHQCVQKRSGRGNNYSGKKNLRFIFMIAEHGCCSACRMFLCKRFQKIRSKTVKTA